VRVLVAGSRDYDDADQVNETLNDLHSVVPITTVIHGGARGADTLAQLWAIKRKVALKPYLAEWRTQGRKAGPIRNQRMLDEGKPDIVVVFINKPLAESRGSADLVRRAEAGYFATRIVSSLAQVNG